MDSVSYGTGGGTPNPPYCRLECPPYRTILLLYTTLVAIEREARDKTTSNCRTIIGRSKSIHGTVYICTAQTLSCHVMIT